MRKIIMALSVVAISLLSANVYSQQPIPMGPGPVISVSPAPGDQTPPPTQPGTPPPPASGINPSTPPPPPPGNPSTTPPPPPPGWAGPGFLQIPANPDWTNQGTINVMATGYDSQGVEKQIPLFVSYQFNGVNYDVNVLNAWNPYTYSWDANVDQPAYQTSYYFNGVNYNFYTVLSTGTFYFNL